MRCYYRGMSRSLRAVACLIVGVTTVVGMAAYEHYSVEEPPSGVFTAAMTPTIMISSAMTMKV